MRYSSTRPPYFRSQSRGLGRVKVFCIGIAVGAILVFLGMTAWQSQQPVEIIVKNQEVTPTPAAAALINDADYVWSEGGLVGVKIPKENDRVSGTVIVEGLANPPDGTVRARVTELVRGKVVTVGEGSSAIKTSVPGTHGIYAMSVVTTPTRNQGTLEISVFKKKDSKEVDTVIIPLQFIAEKKAVTSPVTTLKPVAPSGADTTTSAP